MQALLIKKTIAVLLVLCFLAVNGFASTQSIGHGTEHSHHKKGTHSSVLCSWTCAASHTLDNAFFAPPMQPRGILTTSVISVQLPSSLSFEAPTSRGPPIRLI